jgi:DNA polymerase III gamma/tau subunit
MLKNIHDKSFKELLTNFHSVIEAGKDLQEFLNGFMEFIRKLLLLKIGVTISDVPTSMLRIFKDTAGMFGENTLLYFISMLMKLKDDIKSGTNAVLLSEMALLKMSKAEDMIPISDLMERLQQTPVQAIHTVAIPSYPSSQEKETIAPSVQRIIGESDTVRENQTKPELTVENLKSKWNDIVEAIKRKSSVSGAYLADALIIGVEKVSLMLEVNNPLVEARIKQCEKDLLNLINSLFDSGLQQLKIVTKLEQKNSESGFSMDKLKEKAPELAKFVEMTDSIIKHI